MASCEPCPLRDAVLALQTFEAVLALGKAQELHASFLPPLKATIETIVSQHCGSGIGWRIAGMK